MPKPDDIAPDFELLSDQGENVRLSDFRGQTVVLFFYPKADTPGCTVEACGIRDDYSEFESENIIVLGASHDTIQDQAKFKAKFNLPFILLADAEHTLSEEYGVWRPKKLFGRDYMGVVRTTFLIDSDGVIRHVFENVTPEGHSKEILEVIRGDPAFD